MRIDKSVAIQLIEIGSKDTSMMDNKSINKSLHCNTVIRVKSICFKYLLWFFLASLKKFFNPYIYCFSIFYLFTFISKHNTKQHDTIHTLHRRLASVCRQRAPDTPPLSSETLHATSRKIKRMQCKKTA